MILLDAKILLELLIADRPKKQQVIVWFSHNQDEFCISMLTVHLVLHFGLKDNLTVNQMRKFLADYPKVALLPEDYTLSLMLLRNGDHEDALQLAQAERVGCNMIVTLDQKFAETYKDRISFQVL